MGSPETARGRREGGGVVSYRGREQIEGRRENGKMSEGGGEGGFIELSKFPTEVREKFKFSD